MSLLSVVRRLSCILIVCLPLASQGAAVVKEESFFTSLDVYPNLFAGHQRQVLCLEQTNQPLPVVDGQLDDPAWQQATTFEGLQEMESGLPAPPELQTRGWVLRSDRGLYLAVRAGRLPLPPPLKDGSGKADPADPALADQGLDIFSFQFNPDIHDFTRRRFTVGPGGLKRTLKDFLVPPWNPQNWEASYRATDSELFVECFIPWELLRDQTPGDGDVLAFNLHRLVQKYVPVPAGPYRYKVSDHYVWQSARCHSMETVDHHPWLFLGDRQAFEAQPPAPVMRLYLDKVVYDHLDESAEAYLEIRGENLSLSAVELQLQVVRENGQVLHGKRYEALASSDVGFGFKPPALPAGQYILQAQLLGGQLVIASARRKFEVAAEPFKSSGVSDRPDTIDLVLTQEEAAQNDTSILSTAIPFPRGMLQEADLANLSIERLKPAASSTFKSNSAWEPVDAAFTIRNRWYRNGSIRWLGVDFQVQKEKASLNGSSSDHVSARALYRLNLRANPRTLRSQLMVKETDQDITLTTGPMKAVISKNAFNLIDRAWLDHNGDGQFDDQECLLKADTADGLSSTIVDTQSHVGKLARTRVWVEEANALRAIIVAEGDYEADGRLAGRHLTRLFFERGLPTIKVNHTYIITHDTNTTRLRHAGLRLGLPDVQSYALASEDQQLFEGKVTDDRSVYLLQTRHDQFLIEEESPGESTGKVLHQGQRTAGWALARTRHGGVQLIARNLWQLFPKELEIGERFMALHLWPRHGRTVFSKEELLNPVAVTQARFAHHGRDLNLKTPNDAYHVMGQSFSEPLLQSKHAPPVAPYANGYIFDYANEAHEANGQGIAMSAEFCIRLLDEEQAASAATQRASARQFQSDTMAIADPKWLYASRVLGELWPRDLSHFGKVEAAIDQRFDEVMLQQVDRLGDYGMFIWPDIHTYAADHAHDGDEATDPRIFHRTWIGTHYQEGRTYYQLFLRSGLQKYWRHARDSSRHMMDVSTVNYASDPRVGKNQTPWGNYHVYGVLPWAGMQGISCHYQNLDYKTWDSFITGDPRGLMQARGWAHEMARSTWANEPTRDALVPVSEALEVYQATHYAPLLKTIHWFKEACVSAPIAQATLPFFGELGWVRMHEQTRDPRVAQRFIEHWGDGNTAKRNGLGGFANMALFYRLTGDERIASLLTFPSAGAEPYLPSKIPPKLTRSMMTLPFAMSVLAKHGAPQEVILDRKTSDAYWDAAVKRWQQDGKRRWGEP